ncbi:MAG: V-type ATPase 116kDa subunit family protein [Candidatus Bathyarchaeia archaeon]
MIKPLKMKKIRAITYRPYFHRVATVLAESGVFHPFISSEAEDWLRKGLVRRVDVSKDLSKIDAILGSIDKAAIELSETSSIDLPSFKSLDEAMKMLEDIEDEGYLCRVKDLLEECRKSIAEGYIDTARSSLGKLRDLVGTYRFSLEFMSSTLEVCDCIVFEGWTPAGYVEKLCEDIKRASEGYSIVEVADPGEEDHPPTVIETPRTLKVFERLAVAYGLPSYHEFNPAIFFSITFPIIFGLMFADVGHGLLLLILGLACIRAKRMGGEYGEIIGYFVDNGLFFVSLGVSSIIGGLLYGDIFGFHGVIHPIGFSIRIGNTWIPIGGYNPVAMLEHGNLMPMFKFALFVGAIHITLGLLINLAVKLVNREYLEALTEPIPWLWLYVGLIYMVFTLKYDIFNIVNLFSQHLTMVIVALVIPLALMILGKGLLEGFMEAASFTFEAVISTIGNTVSYGRVMALLLSHGMMSSMFIQLSHGMSLPVQIAVIALGTFLVMFIEGLIVFVHTVRLHWVEWFSKFYKGEGIEFKPLRIGKGGYV